MGNLSEKRKGGKVFRLIGLGEKIGFVNISAERGSIDNGNSWQNLNKEYESWLIENELEASPETEETYLNERNIIEDHRLEEEIKKLGFTFKRTKGGYLDFKPEYSFLVYCKIKNEEVNFDMFLDKMLELCGEFKQDSIMVKRPGYNAVWLNEFGDLKSEENSGDKVSIGSEISSDSGWSNIGRKHNDKHFAYNIVPKDDDSKSLNRKDIYKMVSECINKLRKCGYI